MVLFTVVTVVYMPLVLPMMLPGVKVYPLAIAKPLVMVMLAPLVAGVVSPCVEGKVCLSVWCPFLLRWLASS